MNVKYDETLSYSAFDLSLRRYMTGPQSLHIAHLYTALAELHRAQARWLF